MMKKNNLLILAVAALGFAACANDETTAVNEKLAESNAISFRTTVAGQMRAADQDLDALKVSGKGFFVTAIHSVGPTTYFDNVQFKWDSGTGTFVSDTKYYWPATGTLDFFAYAPTEEGNTQLDRSDTDYKIFTVTPSTTVAQQVDLIYANTDGKAKAGTYSTGTYGSLGVPLNFRHAGAKIVVKVKNSTVNDLQFEITQMKIVNVDGSATFTYNDTPSTGDGNTDGKGSGTLLVEDWSDNDDAFTASYPTAALTTNTVTGLITTGQFLNGSGTFGTQDENLNMILIPQTTPDATSSYSGTAADAAYTGSYIALKMVIKKAGTNIVIEDASLDNKWAMWPVKFTWAPGNKYTYTIDLADGGYWETNTADGNADLDPILEGAIIKFVDVTVDTWGDGGETAVSGPSI